MTPALRSALLAKFPGLAPFSKGRHKGADPLHEIDDAIKRHALAAGASRDLMQNHVAMDADETIRTRTRVSREMLESATALVKLVWRSFDAFRLEPGEPLHGAFMRCDAAVLVDMFDESGASDKPTRYPPRTDAARLSVALLIVDRLGPFFGFRLPTYSDTSPLVPSYDHPLRAAILAEQTRIDGSHVAPAPDKRQRSLPAASRGAR